MNITLQNGTLSVTGLRELNSANAHSFRSAIATVLSHDLQTIEIDLSLTRTVDGAGLGALVLLHETANRHRNGDGVAIRLANPRPAVQQLIELVRLHHLFQMTPSGSTPDEALPRST